MLEIIYVSIMPKSNSLKMKFLMINIIIRVVSASKGWCSKELKVIGSGPYSYEIEFTGLRWIGPAQGT